MTYYRYLTFLVVLEDLKTVKINNKNLKHVITTLDKTELDIFITKKQRGREITLHCSQDYRHARYHTQNKSQANTHTV